MNTLFDDVALATLTLAFAISAAALLLAMLAGAA